jgi:hypothetical protein
MTIEANWFEVKEHKLDEEWSRQADRMYAICKELADAKRRLNEVKNTLEVVYAEQARDARLHPQKYGIDKATVDAVKDAVTVSAATQEAERSLIEAKHEVDLLEAAVTGMEHKKRALENYVQLHAMSYFAEPKASGEAQKKASGSRSDRVFGKDRRKTI